MAAMHIMKESSRTFCSLACSVLWHFHMPFWHVGLTARQHVYGSVLRVAGHFTIAPINAAFITLTFTQISLDIYPGSNNDWVRVYQCSDSACSQSVQLAQYTGQAGQQTVTVTGIAKVIFTSDGNSEGYSGFTATWTTVS
jgi:hypothetical protein